MTITASEFFSLPPETISKDVEADFFSSLKTGNATFKKTASGRFSEIDARISAMLSEPGRKIELLDIGISSGATTLELLRTLEAAELSVSVVGTDQSFEAFIVPGPMGGKALIQPDGHILQYELFGAAFRAWSRRLDTFTGRHVFNHALRRLFAHIGRESVRQTGARRVELVSPRLRAAPSVTLIEDDVLGTNPLFVGRFDLIRAANILNLDYFEQPSLRSALGNLRSYLKGPGALLLVVRTEKTGGALNNGSLFRMTESGRLDLVERYGAGSEVEALVPVD